MFYDLTIRDVRRETDDAVAISFDVPDVLAEAYDFAPGQYLTLRAEVNGQDIRRSYSIASAPGEPLTVGVRKIADGTFSSFAHGLQPGDTISVMPPEGHFTCTSERNIVLIAAGSGVTPMISIAAAALARKARVTLVYGNRTTDSIMFREALAALKDRYIDRFTLLHILSREPQDVPLFNGRISGEKIEQLARAGAVDLDHADGIFLCGPTEMIRDVTETLRARGIRSAGIHYELFYVDGEPQRKPRSQEAESAAQRGVAVAVVLDGSQKEFRFDSGDENIVGAAARQGLDLPYSCKGGMCCTCRCKVVEGSAEMAVNYSLEQWEMDAGFTLACQARPTSDRLVLDFDAA
ncbi:1,2-phenylacetyl-CoA epoxidase subunit PaaE [Seohaeicola nanhaiensis]|uniref:1,2-phenylacetyl-CoA epoxidase subunit PaaE n=1 Tax=Seohaeicola nanhaiensis TaxID=1387282 RepID=A0ABV9KGR1_9RHOB